MKVVQAEQAEVCTDGTHSSTQFACALILVLIGLPPVLDFPRYPRFVPNNSFHSSKTSPRMPNVPDFKVQLGLG